MQLVIERYMSRMIEDSTAGFSVSGLERLDREQAYLFMSNHRDITLDPAFTNYALFHNGFDTVRIAIGDNLLTKPYVSDLMRLNKSFIVRRSARGPREMLKVYRELSACHYQDAGDGQAQERGIIRRVHRIAANCAPVYRL